MTSFSFFFSFSSPPFSENSTFHLPPSKQKTAKQGITNERLAPPEEFEPQSSSSLSLQRAEKHHCTGEET